jgi:cytoskeletal protein CcmA (bactofilin family)
MFSKDNKGDGSNSQVPEDSAEKILQRVQRREVGPPTILSIDSEFVGELHCRGELQVDGRIEGSATSRSMTIGTSGRIYGSAIAKSIRIYGRVEGLVEADDVFLNKSAVVDGDVIHGRLSIEAGANISGRIAHREQQAGEPESGMVHPKKGAVEPKQALRRLRDEFTE